MVATLSDTPPTPKRRTSRRRLVLLSGVALFLAAGWQAVERFVDIERYRPLIDRELEELIKLPLSFGAMDLNLFPTPRLVLRDVSAGEGDFAVHAPKVSVTAGLARLLRGELALDTVTIHDARIQMPEERGAFQARWAEYLDSLHPPVAGSGALGLKVTLEDIEAPALQIWRGEQPFVGGGLRVLRVTGGAPEFVFDLHDTAASGGASARGALVLDVYQEPRIQGSAEIGRLALAALTGDPAMPPFLLNAETTFTLAGDNSLSIDAKGQVHLPDQAEALGPFALRIHHDEDSLRLDDLRLTTVPLSLTGSLELFHDNRWSLALDQATLGSRGIDWLVARVPGIPVRSMEGRSSGAILNAIRFNSDPTLGYTFAGGTIAVEGVRLESAYAIDDIRGTLTVENDVYQLADFSNGQIEATGTMVLDYEADKVELDLTGRLNLGPDFPLPEALSTRVSAETGVISVSEFKATFIEGKVQRPTLRIAAILEEGSISAYDGHQGAYAPATAVEGEAAFSDGVLHVTRLAGPQGIFSGTATPDESLQRWTVSSTFTSDLASPLWDFIEPPSLTFEAGKLHCSRLEGVFVRGEKAPESLRLEATVSEARLAVRSKDFTDTILLPTATISSTDAEATFDGKGASDKFGPISAEGTYALASGAVDARVRLRPIDAAMLPESWRRGVGDSLLKAMGELPLRIRYGGMGNAIEINGDEPLAIKGSLDFPKNGKTKAPFSLDVRAQIPADWLAPHVSGPIEPTGLIKVETRIGARDGLLTGRADFTETTFDWSIFQKKPGFPASLQVNGIWSGGRVRLSGGQVEVGSERVPFAINDGVTRVDPFVIELAPLSPLLPAGGVLGGRLAGRYGGDGGTWVLNFEEATAKLTPALLPITLDGLVVRHGAAWRLEDVAWTIGASRGVIQAVESGDRWQGRVGASEIHGSELKTFQENWKAHRGDRKDSEELPWRFTGDFEVTADTVFWAEATLVKARSLVRFTPGALQATELELGHGAGQITGQAGYTSARDDNPSSITADLTVQGVDAVLLEGLFLEKARGLAGLMDGHVALTIPMVADTPSAMHTVSGNITFDARDGTLGKAGLASKLLAALRTTDILRLRVPHLKDRGFSFKTLTGRVSIEQGVFRLDPFSLHDSAYVMEIKATFDYPNDTAGGGGEVQVLEGVTGVTRRIPILGDAANLVSRVLSVPIKVSGTAKDPVFGVGVAVPSKSKPTP